MQKLPNKDYCSFTDITLDEVLDTDGDSNYSYLVICDLECTNECKNTNTHFQFLPLNFRKMKN